MSGVDTGRQVSRYRIRHLTRYDYSGPVAHSHQMLHLRPRPQAGQVTLHHSLAIDPEPGCSEEGIDAFGNPVSRLQFLRPGTHLAVESQLEVEVHEPPPRDANVGEGWEAVAASLAYDGHPLDLAQLEPRQYLCESPHVRIKREFATFGADCFAPGRPLLACAEALMQRIHAEFTYAPGATQIGTPLLDVLRSRRGVCQDFAHLMIACLRIRGLAARYVSGYLRTVPRDGAATPALLGADASHAWVAVYAPPHGWVALDPTNNLRVGRDHVTLAWGRDFGDVSPLRGMLSGGGSHQLTVSVAVQPLALP